MDEAGKLLILSRLAHKFNEADITWALGASCFLYLKGICGTFHDLDFMVSEPDVLVAEKILGESGQKQPEHYDRLRYGTTVFSEYQIAGVDIDLMAGFSIRKDGVEYPFPLRQENIVEYLEVNGESIPVESLAVWRERYALMGRSEKVALIDSAGKK